MASLAHSADIERQLLAPLAALLRDAQALLGVELDADRLEEAAGAGRGGRRSIVRIVRASFFAAGLAMGGGARGCAAVGCAIVQPCAPRQRRFSAAGSLGSGTRRLPHETVRSHGTRVCIAECRFGHAGRAARNAVRTGFSYRFVYTPIRLARSRCDRPSRSGQWHSAAAARAGNSIVRAPGGHLRARRNGATRAFADNVARSHIDEQHATAVVSHRGACVDALGRPFCQPATVRHRPGLVCRISRLLQRARCSRSSSDRAEPPIRQTPRGDHSDDAVRQRPPTDSRRDHSVRWLPGRRLAAHRRGAGCTPNTRHSPPPPASADPGTIAHPCQGSEYTHAGKPPASGRQAAGQRRRASTRTSLPTHPSHARPFRRSRTGAHWLTQPGAQHVQRHRLPTSRRRKRKPRFNRSRRRIDRGPAFVSAPPRAGDLSDDLGAGLPHRDRPTDRKQRRGRERTAAAVLARAARHGRRWRCLRDPAR